MILFVFIFVVTSNYVMPKIENQVAEKMGVDEDAENMMGNIVVVSELTA